MLKVINPFSYQSYYALEFWYVNPEERMQRLSPDEIKAGMKLAKDVVLDDGRILPVFDPYEIDLRKNPTVFVTDIIS